MRYFRRTEEPAAFADNVYSSKPGTIVNELFFGHYPIKPFNGNEYWEEVIVTPKPQPKKYKKEVALFQIGSSVVVCEAGDYIPTDYYFNRITDWALVEFVEKT